MKGFSVNEVKSKLSEGWIALDFRKAGEFASKFLRGSLYAGPVEDSKDLTRYLEQLDGPKLLITAEGLDSEVKEVMTHTSLHGIGGYLSGGLKAWEQSGEPLDMIIDVDAYELALDLPHDQRILVLDVRPQAEFTEAHVEAAMNIPLEQMTDLALIAQLEEDQNIYIYSGQGLGSVAAASILKREEYHNIRQISGGWNEIQVQEQIPITKPSTPAK